MGFGDVVAVLFAVAAVVGFWWERRRRRQRVDGLDERAPERDERPVRAVRQHDVDQRTFGADGGSPYG